MPNGSSRTVRYRFGSWELSPDCHEVRKNGRKIRVREQSFRVLLALLESPDTIVGREDLRRLLWADDTFVDFDKGLNMAVNQLRQVLSDSASAPRYIETVPKHGYRFIAEVHREFIAAKQQDDEPTFSGPSQTDKTITGEGPAPPLRVRWPLSIAVLALIAVSAIAVTFALKSGPTSSTSWDLPVRAGPLTTYPGIEDAPSFSPDGSQVAFARRRPGSNQSDIWIQLVGGNDFVEIAGTPDDELSPAWSPDGSAIAYLRRGADAHIDLMFVPPRAGETPRRIATISYPSVLNMVYQSDLLSWSPDGTFVYYPHAASTEYTAIWRIDVRTGQAERVTDPEPRSYHSYPRVSHNGRWMALQQRGGRYVTEVLVIPLSREGLPAGPAVSAAHGLTVGPLGWRGDELLVLSRSNTLFELLRWDARSRKSEKLVIPELAGPGARLQAATVSRDGRRFAVTYSRLDLDIWRIELSPTGEFLRSGPLIDSTYLDLSVDWSADGRQIIFKSTRSGSHEAWMANPDGSGLRQLTRMGGLGDPHLSPDGKEFAFNRGEGGNSDIYVADVETGKLRQVTYHPAEEANARWSRDGKFIYFDSDRTGRCEIWKISKSGGEPVQVTRSGGSNSFESPDGRFVYFGRDRHVWRMPAHGGPEERLFESLVSWASLAMGSRHMYFVRGESGVPGYGTDIYSFELASGRIQKVAEARPAVVTLAAAPDERQLIYARPKTSESDLMLVEFPAK